MRLSYLLIFFSLSVLGQTKSKIEVIPNPKSIEDFDHQYKGCLENSECDQVMGLQLSRWKVLIAKLKDENQDSARKVQFLEHFRSKYGLPVEFYTSQKSQQGFKPLLFNSPCKNHNPKDGVKVLRGVAFLKSLDQSKGMVWRDQTQIEVPVGELLQPQPVIAYLEGVPTLFQLPVGDQPLFIKDKKLFVLKEEDDFFYMLGISASGDWKIENVDLGRLSEWQEKISDVNCPKDAKPYAPKTFETEFCRSVWDEDLKKSVVVKMHLGCST